MGRKKKKNLPLLENVTIVDIGTEGKSVGRVDNMVVFTQYTVPGDIVDIQVTKKRSAFMEGTVKRIVKPSDERVEPFCSHYGMCGGCKWQVLPYEKQLHFKQKMVSDALTRVGGIDIPDIDPIVGSPKTIHYRNKLEYTFCTNRWLTTEEVQGDISQIERRAAGFHLPGKYNRIVDVDTCYLQDEPSNKIRRALKQFCIEENIPFYDFDKNQGFMRSIFIRNSTSGEIMASVVFCAEEKELETKVMEFLMSSFPEITVLVSTVNPTGNSLLDHEIKFWTEQEYMTEHMEGLKFKVSPRSFYQTNPLQAYELYKYTRDLAGLTGNEIVYDLYTGTGTIANFVAKSAKKVVGIEYVEDAIVDAKYNSELNNIENTVFYAGNMKKVLTSEFIEEHGAPDVIITDPPRAGMDKEVVQTILDTNVDRVVYVSCNPVTQARDLKLMDDYYKVVKVLPVDMFPHTAHVENIVLLEKKHNVRN